MKMFTRFVKGILLKGETSDPSDNLAGSMWHNSTTNRIKAYVESAVRIFVSEDQSQTLSNKNLVDNSSAVVDNSDPTKQIKFDAGGTTGTSSTIQATQTANRTLLLPDISDTLVSQESADQGASRLQNKDLDASNTRVVDPSDTTKKVGLDVAGASTGTTTTLDFNQTTNKTITFPDASTTLVGQDTVDALSNKTQIDVDNIRLDGNTVSSTDVNGDLNLSPNGTGSVVINTDLDVDNLNLNGNSLSSSNVNGNINLVPNGIGEVDVQKDARFRQDIRFDETTDAASTGSNATLAAVVTPYTRLTNASLASIDMIPAGSQNQIIYISNATGNSVTVNNDTGGTAANRVFTGTGENFTFQNNSTIGLIYDFTSSRWRMFGGGSTGNVAGPVSATDNAAVRFDGATGRIIQNSGVIIDDSNNITGAANISGTGATLSGLTASRALQTDGSKNLQSSAVTTTELGYVSGVTSAIQTQLDGKVSTTGYLDLNFIDDEDRDAEVSVGDWAAYADAAGTSPVDMTGGSPNTTIARTTTAGEVLRGAGSFEINKSSGASRQGEGVSVSFTVPPAYQAKVCNIQIPWRVTSGTISSGDFKVFIYDVTNSVLITPSNNDLTGTQGTLTSTFTTSSPAGTPADQTYRVGFHVASTTNASVTISFDDVKIVPGVPIETQVNSDWISAGTLSITATTSNPTKGGTIVTDKMEYRRVGNCAHIRGEYRQTSAGTLGSGDYLFAMPSGLQIDGNRTTFYSTVEGSGNFLLNSSLGTAMAGTTSNTRQGVGSIIPYDATRFRIATIWTNAATTAGNAGFISSGDVFTLDLTNVFYTFDFMVPIQGWGSQGAVAADQTDVGWTQYTPTYSTVAVYDSTISAVTKATTGITVDYGQWRRVGDSMEIMLNYNAINTTGGSETAGIFLVPLPNGYSIDTTKITRVASTFFNTGAANYQGGSTVIGHGMVMNSSVANNSDMTIFAYNSSYLAMFATRNNAFWSTTQFGLRNAAGTVSATFHAVIPIQGWSMNQRAPTLIGSVTSNSTSAERIERARITNSGTPTVASQSGSWITSLTDNGTGDVTINYASNTFASAPTVVVSCNNAAANNRVANIHTAATTTSVRISTIIPGTGAVDADFDIIIMGPRS